MRSIVSLGVFLMALCAGVFTNNVAVAQPTPVFKPAPAPAPVEIDCGGIHEPNAQALCLRVQAMEAACGSEPRCSGAVASVRKDVRRAGGGGLTKVQVAAINGRLDAIQTLVAEISAVKDDTSAIRRTVNETAGNVEALVQEVGETKDGVELANGKLDSLDTKVTAALNQPKGCAVYTNERAQAACLGGSNKVAVTLLEEVPGNSAFAHLVGPDGTEVIYDGRPDPFSSDEAPPVPYVVGPLAGLAVGGALFVESYLSGDSGTTQVVKGIGGFAVTSVIGLGISALTD